MRKLLYVLFPIVLLNQFWLPAAEIDGPNVYGHKTSLNKNEHGKWSHMRLIIKLYLKLMKLMQLLLEPVKLALHSAPTYQCTGLDTNHSFSNGDMDEFMQKVKLITPGTKWCGPGNIAESKNDIGVLAASDNCCKHHDLCPMHIPAGKTMFGLKNGGLFTRSLCSCDANFYNCLKQVDSAASRQLGTTYFNVLGPQCFEEVDCSRPKVKCRKRQKNGTQFQWSDNPKF